MVNNRILPLDWLLANQIAAGEVVERPASVIKELIENSIDAGATYVEVDIEGGGTRLIRVRDDGQGIEKDDLILAFARHATSKIRSQADLTAIGSLGFRGEALASIAAVSRCRLISKPQQQESAWQIQIAPDLTPTLQPTAHPEGTTIEVADLFYNMPARRRFLRSEKTEFQAIDEIFKRLALANPRVSFRLKHQQIQIRYFAKLTSSHIESARIAKICGQQFMQNAMEVSLRAVGLDLQGWIGAPTLSRRQSDCQYFFVNQRAIKDRLINHVIKSIYQQHRAMVEGSYPCYVLNLTINADEVDVNVHPTKQEVRFGQSRLVHDFMAKCVQQTLATLPGAMPLEEATLTQVTQRPELQLPLLPLPLTSREKKIFQPCNRYSMVEEMQGISVVDLGRAKTALMDYYFTGQVDCIETKPLLFPQRVMLNQLYHNLEQKIAALASLGFIFKVDNQQLILLQQPYLLTGLVDPELLLILLAQAPTIATLIQTLAQALTLENLAQIPPVEFANLLKTWLLATGSGPWLKLSHAQFGTLLEQDYRKNILES